MTLTLEQRLTASSCYFPFIGAVAAVYIRLTSHGDDFVRGHALQALALHFATYAAGFLLGAIGVPFINTVFLGLTIGAMVILAYRAYGGHTKPVLPAVDDQTRDLAYAQMALIGLAGLVLRLIVGRDLIGLLVVLAWAGLVGLLAYQANRSGNFTLPGLGGPSRRLLSL